MAQVLINRAPLLTLWASVVARRLGYAEEEALTLGRAISALTAQSKGRRLGMYKPGPADKRAEPARRRESRAVSWTEFMGRRVPTLHTEDGLRALSDDVPIDPDSVRLYLEAKFAGSLADVYTKLTELAAAYPPEELAFAAMSVYMGLRPRVPSGTAGWGRQGVLDLDAIDQLIEQRRH